MWSSTPYGGEEERRLPKARLGVRVHCTGEERREVAGKGGAGKRGLECESTAREKKGGRVPEREGAGKRGLECESTAREKKEGRVPESEVWSASPLHRRRKKGGCRNGRVPESKA